VEDVFAEVTELYVFVGRVELRLTLAAFLGAEETVLESLE
jgi:hypothetical protein